MPWQCNKSATVVVHKSARNLSNLNWLAFLWIRTLITILVLEGELARGRNELIDLIILVCFYNQYYWSSWNRRERPGWRLWQCLSFAPSTIFFVDFWSTKEIFTWGKTTKSPSFWRNSTYCPYIPAFFFLLCSNGDEKWSEKEDNYISKYQGSNIEWVQNTKRVNPCRITCTYTWILLGLYRIDFVPAALTWIPLYMNTLV